MKPIWVWDRQHRKWALFPGHLLEEFDNNLQGFDKGYWGGVGGASRQAAECLAKYPYYFARQSISSYGRHRFIFLPGLPRLVRLKLKFLQYWGYTWGTALPNFLVTLLLTVALLFLLAVQIVGVIAVIKMISGI